MHTSASWMIKRIVTALVQVRVSYCCLQKDQITNARFCTVLVMRNRLCYSVHNGGRIFGAQ